MNNTKERILHAFNDLIRKGDFTSVTVFQIVRKAGISRATFYRHFRDKYDVMNYNYSSLLNRHIEQAQIRNLEDLFLILLEESGYWKPLLPLFDTEGVNSLYSFMRDYSFNTARNLYEYGNVNGEGEQIRTMSPRELLQLHFFTCGAAELYEDWIRKKIPLSARETSSAMYELLPACLRQDLF